MKRGVISRALAVTAVGALGAVGVAGAVHASVVPSRATAAVKAAPVGAKPYDFNGDGYADLAIGDPYGTVGSHTSAGFVTIVYGSSAGLNTAKKQTFSQDSSGVPGAGETADHFGFSLVSLDYDGDGYADLLVGAPDEDTTAGKDAGSETILWGSPSGLTGTGSDVINEPSGAGASHRFGYSLAAADFDGDGYTDWVDTSPGDNLFWPFQNPGAQAQARKAGASARTFKPTAKSVRVRGSKQARAAAADDAVTALIPAVGDVDGDGKPDLAIGWQDTDAPTSGFDVWRDFTPADGPSFGGEALTRVDSLAIGDFDGDGFGDVAAGAADESNGVGGHVTIYKGDADVTLGSSSTLNQASDGVPGDGVASDRFGYSLSAGDVNHDGKADLAVGVPYKTVSSASHAGEVVVLYGATGGLTGTGSQAISQNTAGVPGAAEANDEVGWTVNLLNTNNDAYDDLIAGAPKENGTDGAVSWLAGTSSVLTGTGSMTFGPGTLGITNADAQIGVRQGRIG